MRPASSGGHRHGRAGDGNPRRLKTRRAAGAPSSAPAAGAIDHTVRDTLKLKARHYEFTPELVASAMLAAGPTTRTTRTASFLRDASGATLWSGRVTDGVNTFNIPLSAFAPSNRDEMHRHGRHHAETKYATRLERLDRLLRLPHRQRHRARGAATRKTRGSSSGGGWQLDAARRHQVETPSRVQGGVPAVSERRLHRRPPCADAGRAPQRLSAGQPDQQRPATGATPERRWRSATATAPR